MDYIKAEGAAAQQQRQRRRRRRNSAQNTQHFDMQAKILVSVDVLIVCMLTSNYILMPIVMHLHKLHIFSMIRGFFMFFVCIFTIFHFHNHRNTAQYKAARMGHRERERETMHPWLNSLSLEIVRVVRYKCVREHWALSIVLCFILFCLSGLFDLLLLSFANCATDGMNTEPKYVGLSLWFYRWITIRRQSQQGKHQPLLLPPPSPSSRGAHTHCIWNFWPCCLWLCNLWTWESEHTIFALLNSFVFFFINQTKAIRSNARTNSIHTHKLLPVQAMQQSKQERIRKARRKGGEWVDTIGLWNLKNGSRTVEISKIEQCWHQYAALIAEYLVGDNEAMGQWMSAWQLNTHNTTHSHSYNCW